MPTAPTKTPTPASLPPVVDTPPQASARTYTGVDGQVHDQYGNTYAPGTSPNTGTGNLSNPGQVVSGQGDASGAPRTYTGADGNTYDQYGRVYPKSNPVGAVFSSKKANDFTSNTMIPALQNGMNNIGLQNDKNSQNDLTHFLPGETTEAYNARVAAVNTAKGGGTNTAPTQTPEDKAAQQIANTPEAGNQFLYDTTGQRLEVPLGTPPPAGYTTNAPANPLQRGHTVVNQFNAENGTTFQQYSDGTYGVAGMDGSYAGMVTADQFDSAHRTSPESVLQGIAAGLSSLKNGPLPLSAPQQAQIDGLNASLASAVKAQQDANANFTGATTVAVNLYGMGNALSGIGLIKSTVDSGISKILDLQTKAATAIAAMQESFDKDNMSQMYTYYQAMTAATKAIDDHITAMHTFAFQQKEHADQEADNLRTFNQKVQQDAITNKREDALAKSTLATQALDRQKTRLDIQAINDMNAGLQNLPGGSVMGANGQPDPNLQSTYLQTIAKKNPGLALQIKAAAEYRLPLTPRFFTTKAGQAFTQQMLQYDPTWDATNYASKQATVTNFASGKYSQQITAFNTALSHINTLASSVHELKNGPLPGLNLIKNMFGGGTGTNSPAGAKLAIAGVTGEMAAAFKASGATDQEIKALGTVNENSSPQDIQRYVERGTELLSGKLDALNSTYVAGVGKPPPSPFLSTKSLGSLSELKNQGYKIDIPGVIYTDPAAFQKADPLASQKMDTARALLIANDIPPTPENILQAAQLSNQ